MLKRFTLFTITLLSVSALWSQPVPELLWYKFNGSGTSVTNYASTPPGGTATATIMGGVTQGGTTLCDGGLIGTGASSTTDYLNTGWAPSIGAGAWTISVRTSGISTNATLYYIFGDINTASFRCFTNGIAGSTNWVIRGAGLTDLYINGGALMTPTMITFVYDPTLANLKGYLNGVLVSTVAQGAVNLTGTGPLKVMGYSTNVGAPAGGVLDDFRLYNRALTAAEVMQIYNPYATPGFLGADATICGGSPFELQLNPTDGVYGDWSTGDLNVDSILVSSGGTYSVDVSGVCGDGNDTIVLSTTATLSAGFLGTDPSLCSGDSTWLGIATPMDSLLWSTGSVNDTITVTTGGTYSVTAYNSCGSYSDTVMVNEVTPLSPGFLGSDVTICVGDTATLTVGSVLDSLLWSTGATTDPIWTTTVGSYTANAYNACGAYTDTVDVLASALVYSGFITPDSTIYCTGDTVLIAADTSYTSYMWSTGDTTSSIWVMVGGTYTLTVTDACGSGVESATVTISTVPVAGFSSTTFTDGTADFTDGTTGTGPFTYSWDFGDGSGTSTLASPSYTYGADGTYFVTLIVSSACGSDTITDSVSIIILGTYSGPKYGVNLSPNPAKDQVNLIASLPGMEKAEVSILSLTGQTMSKQDFAVINGKVQADLSLSGLSAGLYFVCVQSGNRKVITRLVVQ